MLLFKTIRPLQQYLQQQAKSGKTTGFVPTMGALHDGHLSLIRQARRQAGITVCSIFVNPTQFNNPDDLAKYPITVEKDIQLLTEAGTDVLFLPSGAVIYPEGTSLPHYDFGYLETVLEGASRPGHFQGVGQVVHRLLSIVMPQLLFMGQKDYQQCLIVQKLLQLTGLRPELVICPVAREANGLAMSSRNQRLTAGDREKAAAIYRSLLFIKEHWEQIPFEQLRQQATAQLETHGFTVDYIAIAAADDLQLLQAPSGKKMLALAAATIGGVRLIDNLFLN